MWSLTFRKLVLICDVATSLVSHSFGQNHATHVSPVHFDCLQGPIILPRIKHTVAVHLPRRGRKKLTEIDSNSANLATCHKM